MARWTETVTFLQESDAWQDEEGGWHEGYRPVREVFCNERRMTLAALAHLRSSDIRVNNSTEYVDVGMRPECEIEVHTIDYEDEDRCLYKGTEYEIQYTYGGGNTIMLGLTKRLSNEQAD